MRHKRTSRLLATTRRGQSVIEFIFIFMFFMALVGFVRAMVYFELDVFNSSNMARYNNIRYVRDSGQLGGDEWDVGFKNITGENIQQIRTYKLRNIPFLAVGNPEKYRWGGSDPQSPAQRELYWAGGTKYPGVTEGVFNLGTVAGAIVLNLKTPFTWN